MTDDEIRAYWGRRENLPEAIIEIIVYDAKWLEHHTVGMKYDSYAIEYSMTPARRYNDRTWIPGMENYKP